MPDWTKGESRFGWPRLTGSRLRRYRREARGAGTSIGPEHRPANSPTPNVGMRVPPVRAL